MKRANRRIAELQEARARIDREQKSLLEQIDARIDELARTRTDRVRSSIEANITRLEDQKEERQQKRIYIEHEIEQLEAAAAAPELFAIYQKEIRKALSLIEQDSDTGKQKMALTDLLASLTVTTEGVKIALSGLVNRRAPGSTLLVLAPPAGLEPTT